MRGIPGGEVEGSRIAFATCGAVPAGSADDGLAVAELEERTGSVVEWVRWDDPSADWGGYRSVVIRSTWDYHVRREAFLAWVGSVERRGVRLWNPATVVRWNADKRYLEVLGAAGVPVVPTEWIDRGSVRELRPLLEARGWERAVVKPSVSATAFRTWSVAIDSAAGRQSALVELLGDSDALVQPFLGEFQREGEWSFVFFADVAGALRLSHAVKKRPGPGDFRVQPEFGGTVQAASPPPALERQVTAVAAKVAGLAPGPLLYARLDGVVSEGGHASPGTFLLTEAELIEPSLFLGHGAGAAGRFGVALGQRLRDLPPLKATRARPGRR